MKYSSPRRGWTVIAIFGRALPSRVWLSRGGEFGFDLGKLFLRPLNLRSLEPILGGKEPVAPRVDQHYRDRYRGVVEGGQSVSGSRLGQDEKDRDECDPD